MTKQTTYRIATHWLGNSYVLANNITQDTSVFDNMRFDFYDEDGKPMDIYQWFITDASESDVEWLEKTFGLLFTYSELLDCFVLCVPHFGTGWDYVPCDILNEAVLESNPEMLYEDSCNPPKFKYNRELIAGGK